MHSQFIIPSPRALLKDIKNIWGWKTRRKMVVIVADDYGNVRLDGSDARRKLDAAGYKPLSHFDVYDALETRNDLEMLYEALTSVQDSKGHHAVFTPFAVPCNIDFEKVIADGYSGYHYELLPRTFQKMSERYPDAYGGAWELWKEGIEKGLMAPQFHGREHLNVKVFEEKLAARDSEVMTCLENRSYASITDAGYPDVSWAFAFDFWEFGDNESFATIISEGMDAFDQVFGYRAVHFTAPGLREHHIIHQRLKETGIKYIDVNLIKKEHQGIGRFNKSINWTGKKNPLGMTYSVRNVAFEPASGRGIDWVDYSLSQIEAAFRWHRPAIISSHRVNYCGHIYEKNRKKGIGELKRLLQEIVTRWPDVEFVSSTELMDAVAAD